MDTIQLLLTLLDIVDAMVTAVGLVALGETWRRLGRVGDDQITSDIADIEQFINLTHWHAQRQ
ncbi:MAG: hypothetical protein ACR2QH_18430 [Geminicoccaceae bacterium]